MRARERGSALTISLIMLALAQALLLAVTVRATLSAQAARRVEDRVLALNAAEAGLAEACQDLRLDGWSDAIDREDGTTRIRVRTEALEQALPWRRFAITARGSCRSQARLLRLRVDVLFDEDGAAVGMRRVDWEALTAEDPR